MLDSGETEIDDAKDEAAKVDLLRFLSYANGMSVDIKNILFSNYILFGSDLIFFLYSLRGKQVLFPSVRRFKKITKDINSGDFEVVSDTSVVLDTTGEDVLLQLLKKGMVVVFKRKRYIVVSEPIKLVDHWFIVIQREIKP